MAPAVDPTPTGQRSCPSCGAMYPADYAVCPRDATPLRAVTRPPIRSSAPSSATPTKCSARLGEGGMGRVYEARHVRLGRHFAIKMLHPDVRAPIATSLARFRREAIGGVDDREPQRREVFDVNAHAATGALPRLRVPRRRRSRHAARARRRAADRRAPSHIARQVANGARRRARGRRRASRSQARERHARRTARRRATRARCSTSASPRSPQEDKLTRTGAILGTPAYMAPEQARGGSAIDHRCDIYALGAILYRAVTGRPAFGGEDAAAHAHQRHLGRAGAARRRCGAICPTRSSS